MVIRMIKFNLVKVMEMAITVIMMMKMLTSILKDAARIEDPLVNRLHIHLLFLTYKTKLIKSIPRSRMSMLRSEH